MNLRDLSTPQAERAEERYPQMEKLAFALVIAARKLKPYFQEHTIVVLTDKPLRRVMNSTEATGRIALWAVELSEFDIQYHLRTAIKGQVVADFIVEFTLMDDQGAKKIPQWNIYMDESSNRQAGGVSVVLFSLEEDRIECMIRLEFHTTNNEAGYEALIAGLDLARAAGAKNMIMHCDSQIVTSQVNGNYECKSERMKRYLDKVKGELVVSKSSSSKSQGRRTNALIVLLRLPQQNACLSPIRYYLSSKLHRS